MPSDLDDSAVDISGRAALCGAGQVNSLTRVQSCALAVDGNPGHFLHSGENLEANIGHVTPKNKHCN